MKTICILGLGYIGLPTASFLATKGYQVHGVDVRQDVVDALNEGTVLIHEPSLDILVKSAVGSGRLKASTVPVKADVFILALPTPFRENKKPDISYVHQGAMAIAPCLEAGNIVILESTSPVGTTEQICTWMQEVRPDLLFPPQPEENNANQVYVAHCPERVLPGRILVELVENDRIVGGVDAHSTKQVTDFYRSFVQGTVFATEARVAEFTKLAENAYRDVNIAFANELSLLCDSLGVDVWQAIEMANKHPRVSILRPGPGVGGHCISVDPWFLVDSAPDLARLIRTAREVNDHKPEWVFARIKKWIDKLNNPVVACMGVAFKPDVDDLRESPSLHIAEKLASLSNCRVLIVEPHIHALPPTLAQHSNVQLCSREQAMEDADILVFLVGHRQFASIQPEALLERMVIDVCGLFRNKCQGRAG